MLRGKRSSTNSRMKVLLPEPEGPAMTKICSSALAAAASIRRARSNGRRNEKPGRAAMLLIDIANPPLMPVTETTY